MNKEKLTMLYNTLCLIDTRGVNTRHMADCLKFIEDALKEMDDEESKKINSEKSA